MEDIKVEKYSETFPGYAVTGKYTRQIRGFLKDEYQAKWKPEEKMWVCRDNKPIEEVRKEIMDQVEHYKRYKKEERSKAARKASKTKAFKKLYNDPSSTKEISKEFKITSRAKTDYSSYYDFVVEGPRQEVQTFLDTKWPEKDLFMGDSCRHVKKYESTDGQYLRVCVSYFKNNNE